MSLAPVEFTPQVMAAWDEAPLWTARFGALLLEHVPLAGARRLLDLGCGTGFPLFELARCLGPGSTCVGVDPWSIALARANLKRRAYGALDTGLVQGDGARLPLAAGVFDLIVINLGINNFEEPAAVLAECARVLAPDGRLALTTNLSGHMREFYAVFREVLRGQGLAGQLPALDSQEAHRGTRESVTALVEGAGLRVARVVEDTFRLRYRDGTALLNHWFVRLGFLDGWLGVLRPLEDEARTRAVFTEIEQRLNAAARDAGEVALAVPMLYVEAMKRGA
jgi:ubiquinone/menaquinone biosynthesis C-methylase UbiE